MMIEELNTRLFTDINAAANLHGYQLWLALFAAKYLVFVIVLMMLVVWLKGSAEQRSTLLLAFIATVISLLINGLIGHIWYHPRPFVLGIGHTYLAHAPTSSFPSDHATALCTLSLIFIWKNNIRLLVLLLPISTLIVAWARVYIGVHFPFDMVGALIVSIFSAALVTKLSFLIERYLSPIAEAIYIKLFAKIFQRQE